MIFDTTSIPGVVLVDIERHQDERGFFARTWCQSEFAAAGLAAVSSQCSVSWNEHRYTLRGMHWQAEPYGENKLVRCGRGAILDVVVDIRRESPTYLQHLAVRLDEDNRRALQVPRGVAHGFLTLSPATEVLYQMDTAYVPEASRGARWDDPAFAIPWPVTPAVISERDRTYPDFVSETTSYGVTR